MICRDLDFALPGMKNSNDDDNSIVVNKQTRGKRRYCCRSSHSALAIKIAIAAVTSLALSIASIGTGIVHANAAAENPSVAAKDIPVLPRLPSRFCTTTLTITSPTDGANFFENERAPGNDGFMTIKFSGSVHNPCAVAFTTKLSWYLDGKFLGNGGTVYKTLFAGCESYTSHTAKLVATFQKPVAKAGFSGPASMTGDVYTAAAFSAASSSAISKSVSFSTGIVC